MRKKEVPTKSRKPAKHYIVVMVRGQRPAGKPGLRVPEAEVETIVLLIFSSSDTLNRPGFAGGHFVCVTRPWLILAAWRSSFLSSSCSAPNLPRSRLVQRTVWPGAMCRPTGSNHTCEPSGIALYDNFNRRALGRRRLGQEDGENTPAGLQHAPARQDHCATLASSAAATCHSTTWTCGSSTPGWPAL